MKTLSRNTLSLGILLGLFGLAGTQAHAQLSLTYSMVGAGPITASTDSLTIAAFSGSASLISGASQTLKIGTASFTATSSVNNISSAQDVSRNLTLNGVTKVLSQGVVLNSLPAFSPIPGINVPASNNAIVESITSTNSQTYTFGDGSTVLVTDSINQNPSSSAATPFTQTFDVTASFLYTAAAPAAVPEPGSIALLVGIGTTGAGVLVRRRKNAKKAA